MASSPARSATARASTGTLAGDLLVFGDIRDLVREGHHLATGVEVDPVIMGLAGAGLAATAATYASVGGATPVRAGLTIMKDARRAGRIGGELAAWTGRSARAVVDMPALRRAVSEASLTSPATSVRAIKATLRIEKAGDLFRLAKDVNRVRGAAGTRAAFDAMKLAEAPPISRAPRSSPRRKPGRPALSSNCSVAARWCSAASPGRRRRG